MVLAIAYLWEQTVASGATLSLSTSVNILQLVRALGDVRLEQLQNEQ